MEGPDQKLRRLEMERLDMRAFYEMRPTVFQGERDYRVADLSHRVTATGLGLLASAVETLVSIVFLASVAGFKRFYLLLFPSPYHPRYDKMSFSFFLVEPEEAEEEEELFKLRTGTNGHANLISVKIS
ncbi:hypothetical protein ACLOJK_027583 [Asimina triloba]